MDLIDYGVLKRKSMQHVEIITGLVHRFVQKTISFGNFINDLSKKKYPEVSYQNQFITQSLEIRSTRSAIQNIIEFNGLL